MEIIHLVLGKANPDRMNGVNKVVYQLATQQASQRRKVSIWGITRNLLHNYGERPFETRLFKAQMNPFALDPALKTALLERKGDIVVHLHGGWIPVFSTLSAFLDQHQIPFVLTPHGAYNTIAMQRSRHIKRLYFSLFESAMLRRACRIHAIGQSEVVGLNRIFPNNKTTLLPYGFTGPVNNYAPLHKQHSAFVLGFVGRLDTYTKGLDLALQAFATFARLNPSAALWLVGDGPDKAKLQQKIAELGIGHKVHFWGALYGEQKYAVIQQMNAFIHPSRNEGLPTAVLEAAQMGVPGIVTHATNMSVYISKYRAGIVVNNENIPELTDAITHLASQPVVLEKMAVNAQKMVAETFNWNKLVPAFDQLYQPCPVRS